MAINKTRLWQLLETVPQKKQTQLVNFIRSDTVGTAGDLFRLLQVLLWCINKKKCPSRPRLWTKIARNEEPYNEIKLRRNCSNLLHRVENWLILQHIESQEWERERVLCQYFINQSDAKIATFYHNATILAKNNYFYKNMTFYYKALNDDETTLDLQTLIDTPIFDLRSVDKNLTTAFVLGRLKNAILDYWGQVVGGKPIDNFFLPAIVSEIESIDYLIENPSVRLYYELYLFFIARKLENLTSVKKIIATIDFLPKSELSDIYLMIENFLNLGIPRKEFSYTDLVSWYEQGDEKNALCSEKGVILSTRLQAILNACLFSRNYDKALYFIKKYKNNIVEEEREELYNLNLAHIYFYQKKYKQSLRLVGTIGTKRPTSYLLAQRILLKTYFIEQEEDVLDAALDNFQHYLYTTKRAIPEHNRLGNLYFVKTLRRVTKLKTLSRPARQPLLKKIREVLEGPEFVSERIWLTEQLNF